MKYKKLKNTDLTVSTIALGTDVYGTDLDEKTSFEMLDFYIQNGGNIIDTANIYADWVPGERGRSEKLIGRWLKTAGNRENYVISTKGGHPNLDTMGISRLSRNELTEDLDESLRRLGTDYVDIYWLHRDDESLEVSDIMDTLDGFVKSGKVRYIGMSNWTCKRIEIAQAYAKNNGKTKLIASQIQYSAAQPNVENNDPTLVLMNGDEYGYFKNNDMTVFAFASQAKGFFSKLHAGGEEALSKKAHERYLNEISLARFERIEKLSSELGHTVGEIAVSVLASNYDFDTIPIVGCKNTEQLEESMNGAALRLTKEQIEYIYG